MGTDYLVALGFQETCKCAQIFNTSCQEASEWAALRVVKFLAPEHNWGINTEAICLITGISLQ
jgi:hypothetical protein